MMAISYVIITPSGSVLVELCSNPIMKQYHTKAITFKQVLKNLDQLNYGNETIDKQATDYVKAISNLLEMHAPLIQTTVMPRPHAAWHTEELREAKLLRMKLKRTWRNGNQERDQ